MTAPRWIARFNRNATNRVVAPLAPHVPGLGMLTHTGRMSRRVYHTPINVFRRPGGYVIALTYGSGSDWVRNVLAEGGCTLTSRGRTYRLGHPRLSRDPRCLSVPQPFRFVLRLLQVSEFLFLSVEGAAGTGSPVA